MKGCTGELKRRIKNKEFLLGGCIMDCHSGAAVEAYAEFGFDFIQIDREHTALNDETVREHARLARALGIPVTSRVAEPSYGRLNPIIDQALDGIFVPRIRSRQEVEQLMSYLSYPPKGVKGFGPSTCPAAKYLGWEPNKSFPESLNAQMDFYNNNFVIGIQVETKEALDNLEDIASVPGIDVIMIGSDDLSLGMGIPGQFKSQQFLDAAHRVIEVCNRNDILPGIAGGDPIFVKYWKQEGMRMFWAAADIISLWAGTKASIEAIRKELKEDSGKYYLP